MKKVKKNNTHLCPICHQYELKDEYDICPVCFWENDPFQYDDVNLDGGANNLSIVKYRQWWEAINTIMPDLIEKYRIKKSEISKWAFEKLLVPRENIKSFINDLTEYNIAVMLSFCKDRKHFFYNRRDFYLLPFMPDDSVRDNNDECLNIIFTTNPLWTCKKYNLIELQEILEQAKDKRKLWEELTPYITIKLNPTEVPKMQS